MNDSPGSLGPAGSLVLRVFQAGSAVASLLFMCLNVEFYGYTSFCFLVTIMGLIVPWSLSFGMFDMFSIFTKSPSYQKQGLLLIVVVGDWVLALLLLAASSSSAGVASLLSSSQGFCSHGQCTRFQLSAALAFLSWLFSFSSALFNLWILMSS